MSSQCFGFDDDETADISNLNKTSSNVQNKVETKEITPDKLSISQIQALLCQDLSAVDSTIDSTTNDTSIYIDEQEYILDTPVETVDENNFYEEPSTVIETPEKKTRKILGDIENKPEKPCKTYKKPVQFITPKKVDKPVKAPRKRKMKKKNDENENFDKFAEQINKQFQQIENFKLVVE